MMKNVVLLLVLLAGIAGYTWFEGRAGIVPRAEPPAQAATTRAGIAPDFAFTTMDGERRRLSDFKGKTIVLNFWATWCAPCVIEFPQMLALANTLPDEAVFVFLSQDIGTEPVERFVKKHAGRKRGNVIVALDTNMETAQKLYQTYKLPETYIIAPDQSIAEKIVGADIDWNSDAMRDKLRRLHRP